MADNSSNFLSSNQEKLCQFISKQTRADTIMEKIILECEDFLTMNCYRQVTSQTNAKEKLNILLNKVIEKGEEECRKLIPILKKVEELQQFWSKSEQVSSKQTVYADNNSFVDNRRLAGGTSKGFTMQVEMSTREPVPNSQHGTGVDQTPPDKDIVATNNSMVLTTEIVEMDIDGNVDFSVKCFREPTIPKPASDTFSHKGPSQNAILERKPQLISWLTADVPFILQHAHSKNVLQDREYQAIKHIPDPESAVINLIDTVLVGEQLSCRFVHLLRSPEINETYPELKKWIDSVKLSRDVA